MLFGDSQYLGLATYSIGFDRIGFFRMRLDEILVLDRRQVDTNIQQGTDDSRASAHHGYTSVRNGILIAFGYDCFDQRQQTVYTPSHLHRYGRRIFGHLLNLSRANGLLFLRFLGELEGGEYLIISIAVAVDINTSSFCMAAASVAIVCISASTSTYFFLPIVRLATISANAAAIEPFSAEILPPPGTGSWPAVSARKPFTVRSVRIIIT